MKKHMKIAYSFGMLAITASPILTTVSCSKKKPSVNISNDPRFSEVEKAMALINDNYTAQDIVVDDFVWEATKKRPAQIIEQVQQLEKENQGSYMQMIYYGITVDGIEYIDKGDESPRITYEFVSLGSLGASGMISDVKIKVIDNQYENISAIKTINISGYKRTTNLNAEEIAADIPTTLISKGFTNAYPSDVLKTLNPETDSFEYSLMKYGVILGQKNYAKYTLESNGTFAEGVFVDENQNGLHDRVDNDKAGVITNVVIKVEVNGESALSQPITISNYKQLEYLDTDSQAVVVGDDKTANGKLSLSPTQAIEQAREAQSFAQKMSILGLPLRNAQPFNYEVIDYGTPTNDGKIEGFVIGVKNIIDETQAQTTPFTIDGYRNDIEYVANAAIAVSKLNKLRSDSINTASMASLVINGRELKTSLGIADDNSMLATINAAQGYLNAPATSTFTLLPSQQNNSYEVAATIELNGVTSQANFRLRSSDFSVSDSLEDLVNEYTEFQAKEEMLKVLPSEIANPKDLTELNAYIPSFPDFRFTMAESSVPVALDNDGKITGIRMRVTHIKTGDFLETSVIDFVGYSTTAMHEALVAESEKISANPEKISASLPTNPTTLQHLHYSLDDIDAPYTYYLEPHSISSITNGYKFTIVLRNEHGREVKREVNQTYNTSQEDVDTAKEKFEELFTTSITEEIKDTLPAIADDVQWSSLTTVTQFDLATLGLVTGVSIRYDVINRDATNGNITIRISFVKGSTTTSITKMIEYRVVQQANTKINNAKAYITTNNRTSISKSTAQLIALMGEGSFSNTDFISKLGIDPTTYDTNNAVFADVNVVWTLSNNVGHTFTLTGILSTQHSSLSEAQRTISFTLTSGTQAANNFILNATSYINNLGDPQGTGTKTSTSKIYQELDNLIRDINLGSITLTKNNAGLVLGLPDYDVENQFIKGVPGITWTVSKTSNTEYAIRAIIDQGPSTIEESQRTINFVLRPAINAANSSIFEVKEYLNSLNKSSSKGAVELSKVTDLTTNNLATKLGITFDKENTAVTNVDSLTWGIARISNSNDFTLKATITKSGTSYTGVDLEHEIRITSSQSANLVDESIVRLKAYIGQTRMSAYPHAINSLVDASQVTTDTLVNSYKIMNSSFDANHPDVINYKNNISWSYSLNRLTATIHGVDTGYTGNELVQSFDLTNDNYDLRAKAAALKAYTASLETLMSASLTKSQIRNLNIQGVNGLNSSLGLKGHWALLDENHQSILNIGKNNIHISGRDKVGSTNMSEIVLTIRKDGFALDHQNDVAIIDIYASDAVPSEKAESLWNDVKTWMWKFDWTNGGTYRTTKNNNGLGDVMPGSGSNPTLTYSHTNVEGSVGFGHWGMFENNSPMAKLIGKDGTPTIGGLSTSGNIWTYRYIRTGSTIFNYKYTYYLKLTLTLPGVGEVSYEIRIQSKNGNN